MKIVFDVSSKENHPISLIDCLVPGLNLNTNLLDVILKFQMFQVAFSSDIEKQYLMIEIVEKYRNYLISFLV